MNRKLYGTIETIDGKTTGIVYIQEDVCFMPADPVFLAFIAVKMKAVNV
jgi:hypothetical protein